MGGSAPVSSLRYLKAPPKRPAHGQSRGRTVVIYGPLTQTKFTDTLFGIVSQASRLAIDRVVVVSRNLRPFDLDHWGQAVITQYGLANDDQPRIDLHVLDGRHSRFAEVSSFLQRHLGRSDDVHAVLGPMQRTAHRAAKLGAILDVTHGDPLGTRGFNPQAVARLCNKGFVSHTLAQMAAQNVHPSIRPTWHQVVRLQDLDAALLREAGTTREGVFKPLIGARSRGVYYYDTDDGHLDHVIHAMRADVQVMNARSDETGITRIDHVLAEERVRGVEYGVEVEVRDGEVVRLMGVELKADSDPLLERFYFSTTDQDPIWTLLQASITAFFHYLKYYKELNLGSGQLHCEPIVDVHGQVHWLDLNVRPAGAKIPLLVALARDGATNVHSAEVCAKLREPYPIPKHDWRTVADWTMYSQSDGFPDPNGRVFDGFHMMDSMANGAFEPVESLADPQIRDRLQRVLGDISEAEATKALHDILRGQAHYPPYHAMLDAFREYPFSNLSDLVEIVEFSRFVADGVPIMKPDGQYIGSVVVRITDESLPMPLKRALMLAAMNALENRFVGRTRPVAEPHRQPIRKRA